MAGLSPTACPQFRIVVIGNTGVGKSSLISSVFNISSSSAQLEIAHDCAGTADISFAHSSKENPRFVLHDSMGFQHGVVENWKTVEKFLSERTRCPDLKECVHAIWLCIETPRTGSRLLQTGDENLLKLAKDLQIPVIVVFTKYDMLIKEHFRRLPREGMPRDLRKIEAERLADKAFPDRIQTFKSKMQVPCVKFSTEGNYLPKTLPELTDITRNALRSVEERLGLLRGTAQQASSRSSSRAVKGSGSRSSPRFTHSGKPQSSRGASS